MAKSVTLIILWASLYFACVACVRIGEWKLAFISFFIMVVAIVVLKRHWG